MKTFKELLEFVQNHTGRVTKVGNVEVVNTKHGVERHDQRTSDFSEHDWNHFHTKAIAALDKRTRDFPNGDHEVMVHSPKQNHAVVYNVKKDKDAKTTQLRVISVMPKGKSNPKQGTKKVMVESREIPVIEIE